MRQRVRSPWEQSANLRSARCSRPNSASSAPASLAVGGVEAVLEVADRLRGAREHDLPDREQRREAAARASVDEADLLPQAEHIGVPKRAAEDLHRPSAGELHRARHREQGRLAGSVRSEERPALAGEDRPVDRVEDPNPCARRRVPAPDGDLGQAQRRALTTRWRVA